MLVVLPTHSGDRDLAVALCEHIAYLGGVQNHECLIVSPVGTNLDGIENVLRDAFGKVHLHRYAETMHGWPYGANEAAMEAMLHVFVNPELRYHYLMLEPDCVPLTQFWLDHIDADYRRCGQPILGVRVPTVEIATGRQVGNHVVGVAVYPKNFPQLCPLVKGLSSMTNGYLMQGVIPAPWDAYFGPYTTKMTAETTLIQHLSRVRNVLPGGAVKWDCPSLENALAQTNRQAVLVHGSKHPDFLRAVTQRTHVLPKIQNQAAPIAEVSRQSDPSHRVESGQPNPPSQDVQETLLTKEQPAVGKVRARQLAEAEAMRKELGIEFALGTPEYKRACYFHTDREWKWPKLKSYASKLEVKIFKRTKGQLINDLVKVEKAAGKEQWCKKLPKEEPVTPSTPAAALPPVPVEEASGPANFGLSSTGRPAFAEGMKVDGGPVDEKTGMPIINRNPNGSPLSDERQQQMRNMLAARQLLPAG